MSAPSAPVTVVIPYFDGAATIGRAVASLAAQSLRPAEIIIVDDASPAALPELQSEVPLRVLRHDRNRGIPSARNTGIRAATGEWIGFLDQDDEWVPEKLERQWRATGGGEAVIFGRLLHTGQGRAPWIWPPSRALNALERGGDAAMRALVRWGNAAPMVTLLVAARIFQRHGLLDEGLTGGSDDMELLLRLVAEEVSFRYEGGGPDDYAAIHHFTGGNYSAHAPRFLEDDLRMIPALAARYPLIQAYRKRLLARTHYTYGRHHDRRGAPEKARRHFREASRLDPRLLRARLARLWLVLPQRVRNTVSTARDRWRGRW